METTTLERPASTFTVRPPVIPAPIHRRSALRKAPAGDDFRERLECMGPGERLRAYRAGKLSHRELAIWAALFPQEPPVVNGELEWIAMSMADLD